MAAPEPRRERDREDDGDLGLGEVVDVVVLADDEALPLALGPPVDAAVDLEDHRAALEREVGVGVRDVDERRVAVGGDVQELAAVPARARCRRRRRTPRRPPERALERVVEVRRDDQLMRPAARSQQASELGQRVDGRARARTRGRRARAARRTAARRPCVSATYSATWARSRACVRRTVEVLDEVGRDLGRARQAVLGAARRDSRPRRATSDEPAGEQRPDDVAEVVLGDGAAADARSSAASCRRIDR